MSVAASVCSRCGAEQFSEGARFCTKCGQALPARGTEPRRGRMGRFLRAVVTGGGSFVGAVFAPRAERRARSYTSGTSTSGGAEAGSCVRRGLTALGIVDARALKYMGTIRQLTDTRPPCQDGSDRPVLGFYSAGRCWGWACCSALRRFANRRFWLL